MSQIDLAHALGVAANTVNRWEAGTRKIPPYLHLALEALSKQGESIMNETCPKCDGRGYTFEVRRMRGWGSAPQSARPRVSGWTETEHANRLPRDLHSTVRLPGWSALAGRRLSMEPLGFQRAREHYYQTARAGLDIDQAANQYAQEHAAEYELQDGVRYRLENDFVVRASLVGASDDIGWVLYTEEEWDGEVNAALTVSDDGGILFQGKHTGWEVIDLTAITDGGTNAA
jgi:hypothetical protein